MGLRKKREELNFKKVTSIQTSEEIIWLPTCDIEAYKLLMKSRKEPE